MLVSRLKKTHGVNERECVMTTNNKILVIDSDPNYGQIITQHLSSNFECELALTGKEGLEKFASDHPPVLVIVDLNLPDMNGLDVCEQLQAQKDQRYCAVFIISSDDSIGSRIKSFETGADDFIAKPFEISELNSRILRTIEYVEQQEKLRILKEEGDETRKIANIAMAQASQYSYIMSFFKSLNHCQDSKQIAALFFQAMDFFKLSATIKITFKIIEHFDKNLADISPIEKDIYDVLENHGRIYEFGKRLLINGRNVSFLVKNLPHDEHAAGEARDFLAVMVEGIEAKIDELEIKSAITDAKKDLSQAIGNINNNLTQHRTTIHEVMSGMIADISSSYHKLDLNDEQETYFTEMVEKGSVQMNKTEDLLKVVQTELKDILDKMEKINAMSENKPDASNESSDSIDLF